MATEISLAGKTRSVVKSFVEYVANDLSGVPTKSEEMVKKLLTGYVEVIGIKLNALT